MAIISPAAAPSPAVTPAPSTSPAATSAASTLTLSSSPQHGESAETPTAPQQGQPRDGALTWQQVESAPKWWKNKETMPLHVRRAVEATREWHGLEEMPAREPDQTPTTWQQRQSAPRWWSDRETMPARIRGELEEEEAARCPRPSRRRGRRRRNNRRQ